MVDHNIHDILLNADKIALAVSGGSDSMALLHWCIKTLPLGKFYVINVEHGIRGEESVADSNFVAEYCRANGVECKVFAVDAPAYASSFGMTLEQAARTLRYNIFAEEAFSTANFVATAHHLQDLAESILMHLARGSGIGGLIGMEAISGYIIRPLLHTSKADIMNYISANALPYRQDSTNADNDYARNYLRNVGIPTLEKAYPAVQNSLVKLGERAREVVDLLDSLSPRLEVNSGTIALDLVGMQPLLAKHILLKACFLLAIDKDIESRHLADLLNLTTARVGTQLDLPHGLHAFKEINCITLTTNPLTDDGQYPLNIGVFQFVGGDLLVDLIGDEQSPRYLIDRDKLPTGTVVRTRRKGDKIKLSYGTKSLGDYFTDLKIPKRLRGTLPVLASGSIIVAIAGVAVGTDFAPTKDSRNIIKIEYIPKEELYE